MKLDIFWCYGSIFCDFAFVEHAPTVSIPDHVRQSGDGHETERTSLLVQRPLKLPHLSSNHQKPTPDKQSSGGFSVAEILQAAEREGEQQIQNDLFTHTSNSLITDQEEPSIMRQAAEFSRFEPENLTSTLNRDNTTSLPWLNTVKTSSMITAVSCRTGQKSVSTPQQMSSSTFTMSNNSVHGHYNPSSPTVEEVANSTVTVANTTNENVRVDGQLRGGESDSDSETSEENIITDLTSPEVMCLSMYMKYNVHNSFSTGATICISLPVIHTQFSFTVTITHNFTHTLWHT